MLVMPALMRLDKEKQMTTITRATYVSQVTLYLHNDVSYTLQAQCDNNHQPYYRILKTADLSPTMLTIGNGYMSFTFPIDEVEHLETVTEGGYAERYVKANRIFLGRDPRPGEWGWVSEDW